MPNRMNSRTDIHLLTYEVTLLKTSTYYMRFEFIMPIGVIFVT